MKLINTSKLWIITRQHFLSTIRGKAFIIGTILGPVFILAVSLLPLVIAQNQSLDSPEARIAVAGDDALLASDLDAAAAESYMGWTVVSAGSPEEARVMLTDKEVDGYLVSEDGVYRFFGRSDTPLTVNPMVRELIRGIENRRKIERFGLDASVAAELLAEPAYQVFTVSGDSEEAGNENSLFIVVTLCMMLYMTIILYGQMIGRSAVTEKTSKTVDLMISSVSAQDLMAGKILGIGFAGILQYFIWISLTLALGKLSLAIIGIGLPGAVNAGTLGVLFVYFVLGFLLYSAAFAALGAASIDEQQLGQMGMPLLLFLILPMVLMSNFALNPSGTMAVVLGIFPMTSPLVNVIRSVVYDIPAWELAASASALGIFIVLMWLAAARIFRVGVLYSGKKVKMREVLGWIRK